MNSRRPAKLAHFDRLYNSGRLDGAGSEFRSADSLIPEPAPSQEPTAKDLDPHPEWTMFKIGASHTDQESLLLLGQYKIAGTVLMNKDETVLRSFAAISVIFFSGLEGV